MPVPRSCMVGWTALHMAANGADVGGDRPAILEELIVLSADPHVELKGNNCLFKAASTGHEQAVYALLATGRFDAKALNGKRKSLADVAHRCNHVLELWLDEWFDVACHTPRLCFLVSRMCFHVSLSFPLSFSSQTHV